MQPNVEAIGPQKENDGQIAVVEHPAALPGHLEPILIQRERRLIHDLVRLVAECVDAEPEIENAFSSKKAKLERRFEEAYQTAIVRFASEKESLESGIGNSRRAITAQYETETGQAEREFTLARRRMVEQYEDGAEAAKAEYQEAKWTITAVYEGNKSGAENSVKEAQEQLNEIVDRSRELRKQAEDFVDDCGLHVHLEPQADISQPTMADFNPFELVRQQIDLAEAKLRELKALKLPPYFRGEKFIWISLLFWLVLVYPAYVLAGFPGIVGTFVGMLIVGIISYFWLRSLAKTHIGNAVQPLYLALERAEGLLDDCQQEADARYHRNVGQGKQKYKAELRQAAETYRAKREKLKNERVETFAKISERFRTIRAAARERRNRDWEAAARQYRDQRQAIQKRFDQVSAQLHEILDRELTRNQSEYQSARESLEQRWHGGLARYDCEVASIQSESNGLCADWSDPAWDQWQPAKEIPSILRFGSFGVSMAEMPQQIPADSSLLRVPLPDHWLPALMPFPRFCSMLLKAAQEGRTQATQLLQNVMLRLLALVPPGKLRFTIVDPVGLGRNFASFMHLADYDEALVNNRIWTEAAHIDQRLADLTEHMETVIQKYLRDQFPTIEDYNAHAQEVAEPYRFLVIANFPVNFSGDSLRRLTSIIQSGPRCGVYTLISIDTSQSPPPGFSYSELEQAGCVRLDWDGSHFKWQDDDFAEFRLQLDAPPAADFGARLLRQIGEKAKEAKRVEVPFDFVAPPPVEWWKRKSRLGIDVPLGRVGATKRQHLRLGEGTSQHVLIAGKTGSGKSTLLHALITNLSLCYSPNEIELYLVDFKKGVEFKTYAAHELPHARVIAVESEREFGLSVLQRLDAELKRRAELFRAAGAQDLASYRQNGSAPLPRILLIVDEFQEFFVEDDKIAQDASLLMDRLVRQGRAFGLHVLLGSQTLGGAYTLARSTIDQMAVRIALQCSEADAHLILSHDNSAARLLSRPGEAIYNDANGLIEGNNPFQIVWLDDSRREDYLAKVQELGRKQPSSSNNSQIVFEGNADADLSKNTPLKDLLERAGRSSERSTYTAWLGEAIAIKDPTAAMFARQSGNNLLMVGQNEAAALGMFVSSLISLAAEIREPVTPNDAGAIIYILDGLPEDSPHAGILPAMTRKLGPRFKAGSRRELASFVGELTAEARQRLNENAARPASLFLFIYGLHRFRDLRKAEDDFGFSSQPQEKEAPASQFGEILREGPGVGIHTIVWCDSLNNLTRTLDRQSIREFELRVLFQMSASDSSTLIDSPLASKLGVHRALFSSEEKGKQEKFRPYGLPSEDWLAAILKTLQVR